MVFTFLEGVGGGGLMLLAHSTRAPSDAEWELYLAELRKHDPTTLKTLTFTDGGAPNGAQRTLVNEHLNGRTSTAVVVTASRLVRGVVTALRWSNPTLKAFPPDDVDGALRYLGVSEGDASRVHREMQVLRRRLGFADLRSILAADAREERPAKDAGARPPSSPPKSTPPSPKSTPSSPPKSTPPSGRR